MVERINLLLKAKNITARQFAEEIGIQPSGMSHILSGRNNPSLDFIMKVVKRWPEININWLMFGKGEMYDGLTGSFVEPSVTHEPERFSQSSSSPSESQIAESSRSSDGQIAQEQTSQSEQQPNIEYDLFSQPVSQPIHQAPKPTIDRPVATQPVASAPPIAQPIQPSQQPSSSQTVATSSSSVSPVSASTPTGDVVATAVESPSLTSQPVTQPHPTPVSSQQHTDLPNYPQADENRLHDSAQPAGLPQPNLVKKKIVKMIVLYDDHSFAEYFPE